MPESNAPNAELWSELIRRVNRDGSEFRLSAFVEQTGADPHHAAEVAESLFARFYATIINDGEITDRERRQLQKLANRLEIDQERRDAIETKLAKRAYREQLRVAQQDGVITVEELAELRELKSELGLARGTAQRFEPIEPAAFLAPFSQAAETPAEAAFAAEPARVIALVEASPQYAARESAARLARVPRTPLSHMSLPLVYMVILLLIGLAVFVVVPRIFPAAFSDGRNVRFMLFLGVPVFGSPLLILLLVWLHMRRFDAGPVTSRAVIIEGQRTVTEYTEKTESGTTQTSGPRIQRTTLADGEGNQTEHCVRDNRLAWNMRPGDAGVVYLRRDWIVDFDCVLTGEEIREGHMPGAMICPACESVYRLDDPRTNCESCGAPLPRKDGAAVTPRRRPYSPWFGWLDRWFDRSLDRHGGYVVRQPSLKHHVEGHVTCGWCRRRYAERPDSPDCEKCGGPLPMPPGNDPGPKPPPPRRRLPAGYLWRLFVSRNQHTQCCIAMLFASLTCCLPFLFISIPLFILGGLGLFHSLIKARRRWAALSHGVPVLGKIEYVERSGTGPQPQAKEISRYRVLFRFEAEGVALQGALTSFDNAVTERFTGEPIWVVYVPNKPYKYAIWPPFA